MKRRQTRLWPSVRWSVRNEHNLELLNTGVLQPAEVSRDAFGRAASSEYPRRLHRRLLTTRKKNVILKKYIF